MYSVRLLKGASREIGRLDKPIANRLVHKLRWLAENLDNINPEPLKVGLLVCTNCVKATTALLMRSCDLRTS